METVSFDKVALGEGFWADVIDKNAEISLPNVYRRFEETGRFRAVRCEKQETPPHIFYDSDVAKWLEAAAYMQKRRYSAEIAAIVADTVDAICASQRPEGYFNSFYQVYAPERIFKERTEHELYCAGHLIEAAVALASCGQGEKLLAAMKRYADYICERFYEKRDAGFTTCGHPEIELALVRLYEYTKQEKYLSLAKFFLDERGQREEEIYPWADRKYDQSYLPVREQNEAVGHAVRALYLYIAMADVGRIEGDGALLSAARALFADIVGKKMHLTGGTGSSYLGERFTVAYHLPNEYSYTETCSAIALALFCDRLAKAENRAVYHEIFERVLYNNILAGESENGKGFFYTNPLESHACMTEYVRGLKEKPYQPIIERVEVFDCSCCPPNLVRFFGELGNYIYGTEKGVLYVNQYISSSVCAEGLRAEVQTEMPYRGTVRVRAEGKGTLALRIPAWQVSIACKVNGGFVKPREKDGYLYFDVDGETLVEAEFEMKPRFVYANENVWENSGRKAVEYGPFVLCAESCDNGKNLRNLEIPSLEGALVETVGGLKVTVAAKRLTTGSALYSYEPPERENVTLRLIPYYAWANRGENDMQVWFL